MSFLLFTTMSFCKLATNTIINAPLLLLITNVLKLSKVNCSLLSVLLKCNCQIENEGFVCII